MLTFEECVKECLGNEDFVKEFDRMMGCSVGGKPRDALTVMIDKATGHDELKTKEDYKKFVAFVYETVWLRLPEGAKDPTQVVAPPPGQSMEELLGITV